MTLIGAFLAQSALAAPAPQNLGPGCANGEANAELTYQNLVEEEYEGDAELVTGAKCKGTSGETCTISKTYIWSK